MQTVINDEKCHFLQGLVPTRFLPAFGVDYRRAGGFSAEINPMQCRSSQGLGTIAIIKTSQISDVTAWWGEYRSACDGEDTGSM